MNAMQHAADGRASEDHAAQGTPAGEAASAERVAELAANLAAVERRIDAATAAAGRADRPGLIVVTKFFPASDVLALAGLGVRDVGENREQEAGPKAAAVAEAGAAPHWHFIGQLQSNKAARVARFAHEVHSVDREGLISALGKASARQLDEGIRQAPLGVYLQLDLRSDIPDDAGAEARGGALPAQMLGLAEAVAHAPALALRGLMAVAPLGEDPGPAFERLAALSALLRTQHPDAVGISAGMSSDLEAAVAAGATRLRIGSDVLGRRAALR